MAESTVKKNQLTPTQEGIIAGLVLLFFGFLYGYLNPWKNAEKTTPLTTEPTTSGSVVRTSLANDSTLLAQATTSTATQNSSATDSALATTAVTTRTISASTEPVSATASHLAPPPYPTETAKTVTTSPVTTTETVKPANKAVITPTATPTEVSKATTETAKPLEATASTQTATASSTTTTTTTAASETLVANTQTTATSTSASIAVQTPAALTSSKLVLAPGSAEAKLQSYLEKGILETPVNMSDIQFEPKETKLTKDSEAKALMLAAVLGQYPQANFLITAYTTENSSDTNSDQLSLLRANALGMQLVKAGVEGKRITIMGMGNKPPVDKTSAAQQKNQRIEISVIK